MGPSLAAEITKAASRQTFYTIRLLVDRERVEDAYRAYAYFRWVDDALDSEVPPGEADASRRVMFLERQKWLLDRCLDGEVPKDTTQEEAMLVELVRSADVADEDLRDYLRHMMLVMDFDVRRRGRLVTEDELSTYTRWLAIAVTGAMHHFIGGGSGAPRDERRHLAAAGAHVVHMLRDTYADMHLGYFNVPRELLDAHAIGPRDVDSDAYRVWVERRVRLARAYFDTARADLAREPNWRYRLAVLCYIARFTWLTDALERDGFVLRSEYGERRGLGTGLRMVRDVASWAARA